MTIQLASGRYYMQLNNNAAPTPRQFYLAGGRTMAIDRVEMRGKN